MKAIGDFFAKNQLAMLAVFSIVAMLVIYLGVKGYQEKHLDGNGEPKEYEVVRTAKIIFGLTTGLVILAAILLTLLDRK